MPGAPFELADHVAVGRVAGEDPLERGHLDARDADEAARLAPALARFMLPGNVAPLPVWHPAHFGVNTSSWIDVQRRSARQRVKSP